MPVPTRVSRVVCPVALLLIGVVLPRTAAAQLFYPPTPQVSLQSAVSKMKSGDFDHDGNRDVAALVGSDVVFAKGLDTGQFSGPLPGPGTVRDFDVADFDGDGLDDLVVSYMGSGNTLIIFSAGVGAFRSDVVVLPALGVPLVVAGDVNGDGRPDVVVYKPDLQLIAYLNQGNGTFLEGAPTGAFPIVAMTTADVNGDGSADVITVTPGATGSQPTAVWSWYFDPPTTAFRLADSAVNLPAAMTANQVVVGDVNGDGRPDVIAGAPGDQAAVLLNTASGFRTATSVSTPDAAGSLAVGDFNDDQILDLAYGRATSQFSVMLGNGDGTFRQPAQYGRTVANTVIATIDLRHDGRLDLVANVAGGLDFISRASSLRIDAGPDMHVTSAGGATAVTLAASVLSGHTGVTFTWFQGTTVIGTGASVTTNVPTGATTFSVRGVAPDGATATDTVTVITDLSFATQLSLDALHTKIDSLGTAVGAGLDAAVSTRASQLSVDAIGGILQTNLDAKMSTRASAADVQALAAAVRQLQGGVTQANLDALGTTIAAVVSASRDLILRADIEQALLLGLRTSIYSTPASSGGLLGQVRAIVGDVLARAPAGLDQQRAQKLVADGDLASAAGDYRTAFYKYSDAYRTLVH